MFGENIVYNSDNNSDNGSRNGEGKGNSKFQNSKNRNNIQNVYYQDIQVNRNTGDDSTPPRRADNKKNDKNNNISRLVVLADDSLFEANNKSNNLNEDSNNLSTSPSNDYTLPPGYIYDSNGIPISISLLHSPSTSISPEKEKKNTKRINTKKFIKKVMNSPRQVVLPLVNKLKTGNPRDKNVLKKEELHLQDHTNTNMNTGKNPGDISSLFNRSSHLKATQKLYENPDYLDEEEEECYREPPDNNNNGLFESTPSETNRHGSQNHIHHTDNNPPEIKQNHEYELSPTLPPPGIGLCVAPSSILYAKDRCQEVIFHSKDQGQDHTIQDKSLPIRSNLTQERTFNKNIEFINKKDNNLYSPEKNRPPPFPFHAPTSPPPPLHPNTYLNREENPPPPFPFRPPSPSTNRNTHFNREVNIENNNFNSNRHSKRRNQEEGSDYFTIEREERYPFSVNKDFRSPSPPRAAFGEKTRQIPSSDESFNPINVTYPNCKKEDSLDPKILNPTLIKGGKKIRRGSTITVNTLPKHNNDRSRSNENYPPINFGLGLGISDPQTFLFGNSDRHKKSDISNHIEMNKNSISGSISYSSPQKHQDKNIYQDEEQEKRYSTGSISKKENKTTSRLNSGRIALEKRRAHDPYLSLFEKEALRKLDETLIQTCSVQEEEFLREAMGSPNGTREYRLRSHILTSPPLYDKRETINSVENGIGNTPLTIDTRVPPNEHYYNNQNLISNIEPSAPPTPTEAQFFNHEQDQIERIQNDRMIHEYEYQMDRSNNNAKRLSRKYEHHPNSPHHKIGNDYSPYSNEYRKSRTYEERMGRSSPSPEFNYSPSTPSPHRSHHLHGNGFKNSYPNCSMSHHSQHHTINTPYASPPPPSRSHEAGNFVPNRKRKIVLIEFSLSDWLRNRFHQMTIDERIARAALHVNDAIFERPSRLRVLGRARTRLYTFINDRLWSGFMIFIACLYMSLSLWEPARRGPVTNDAYYVSWTMPKSIEEYVDLRMDLLTVETCIVCIFFIDIILGIIALGVPDYLGLREQFSVLEGLSTKALYEIIIWTWVKLILAVIFIIDIAIVFDYGPFENQPWWSRIFRPLYVIALSRDLQRWCILLGKTMYRLRDFILVIVTVLGLWSLIALLLFQGSDFYTKTTISGVTLASYSNPADIALRGGLLINGGDCPGPSCYYTGGVDGASYSWDKRPDTISSGEEEEPSSSTGNSDTYTTEAYVSNSPIPFMNFENYVNSFTSLWVLIGSQNFGALLVPAYNSNIAEGSQLYFFFYAGFVICFSLFLMNLALPKVMWTYQNFQRNEAIERRMLERLSLVMAFQCLDVHASGYIKLKEFTDLLRYLRPGLFDSETGKELIEYEGASQCLFSALAMTDPDKLYLKDFLNLCSIILIDFDPDVIILTPEIHDDDISLQQSRIELGQFSTTNPNTNVSDSQRQMREQIRRLRQQNQSIFSTSWPDIVSSVLLIICLFFLSFYGGPAIDEDGLRQFATFVIVCFELEFMLKYWSLGPRAFSASLYNIADALVINAAFWTSMVYWFSYQDSPIHQTEHLEVLGILFVVLRGLRLFERFKIFHKFESCWKAAKFLKKSIIIAALFTYAWTIIGLEGIGPYVSYNGNINNKHATEDNLSNQDNGRTIDNHTSMNELSKIDTFTIINNSNTLLYNPPVFDSFFSTFVLLFQVATTNDWYPAMYATMKGCETWWAAWYFIIYRSFSALLLFQITTAIFLDTFLSFEGKKWSEAEDKVEFNEKQNDKNDDGSINSHEEKEEDVDEEDDERRKIISMLPFTEDEDIIKRTLRNRFEVSIAKR